MSRAEQDQRKAAAFRRNPRRCSCQGGQSGPSTRRGAVHLSTCEHSTLADTTRPPAPPPRRKKAKGRRTTMED